MTRTSRWLARAAIVVAACTAGCGEIPQFQARAVYGPELEFRANLDSNSFDEVLWSDIPRKVPKCPLVIHLESGDFTEDQMGSITKMRQLESRVMQAEPGRRRDKDNVNVTVLNIDLDRARITTYYHDERLVSVIVRVVGPTKLTLGGKPFTLPMPRSEMLEKFGTPAKWIE